MPLLLSVPGDLTRARPWHRYSLVGAISPKEIIPLLTATMIACFSTEGDSVNLVPFDCFLQAYLLAVNFRLL